MTTREFYDGINEKGAEVLLRFGGNEGITDKIFEEICRGSDVCSFDVRFKRRARRRGIQSRAHIEGIICQFRFRKGERPRLRDYGSLSKRKT